MTRLWYSLLIAFFTVLPIELFCIKVYQSSHYINREASPTYNNVDLLRVTCTYFLLVMFIFSVILTFYYFNCLLNQKNINVSFWFSSFTLNWYMLVLSKSKNNIFVWLNYQRHKIYQTTLYQKSYYPNSRVYQPAMMCDLANSSGTHGPQFASGRKAEDRFIPLTPPTPCRDP